jgi:phospholipase C
MRNSRASSLPIAIIISPASTFKSSAGSRATGECHMQGFVKDYFTQTNDVNRSQNIVYYFTPDKLPVLTTLATESAVFNGWFSSIPGPTICNRAFAHYGTSFGQVGMDIFYILDPIPSIYERMVQAGHSDKIYYYDQQSSTEIVNLLKNHLQIFANYQQLPAELTLRAGGFPQVFLLFSWGGKEGTHTIPRRLRPSFPVLETA